MLNTFSFFKSTMSMKVKHLEKLQYDSFYKFLVSLGSVLVALPAAILYVIFNIEPILISKSEYELLSEYSLNALENKKYIINLILTNLPTVTALIIAFGLFLLVFGGINWYLIQRKLDEQVKADTIMKTINAHKVSETNIRLNAIKEGADSVGEISEKEENISYCVGLHNIDNSNRINTSNALAYMRIEDLCYERAIEKYHKNYHLKRHIAVGDYLHDFVAISKKHNVDLIFEVKYWKVAPGLDRVSNLLYKRNRAGLEYENTSQRKCENIIIIVTQQQYLKRIQNAMSNNMSKDFLDSKIKIKYVLEEDLRNNNSSIFDD